MRKKKEDWGFWDYFVFVWHIFFAFVNVLIAIVLLGRGLIKGGDYFIAMRMCVVLGIVTDIMIRMVKYIIKCVNGPEDDRENGFYETDNEKNQADSDIELIKTVACVTGIILLLIFSLMYFGVEIASFSFWE